MEETVKTEELQIKNGRNEKGRFVKGSVHNPHGNTHTRDIDNLIEALDKRAKRAKFKDFDALVADRALKHKEVLIAVIKKIYREESSAPIINLYTQIWNGLQKKAKDVEFNGRVHIGDKTEVPA